MNKINLIFRALSCAVFGLTGVGVYTATTIEPLQSEQQAVTDPNVTTIDNGHGTITIETKPGDSHYIEEDANPSQTTENNAERPKPSGTSNNSIQSKPATKPSSTPQSSPTTYKYSNIHDFEQAYIYHCPQDVPAGEFHLPLRKYVALGYIGSYINYTDINTAAIYAWTLLEGGFGGQPLVIFIQKMTTINNWSSLTPFVLIVDTNTRSVRWEYRGNIGYSQDLVPQLDNLANQLQNRISGLDQQYYAKCGR